MKKITVSVPGKIHLIGEHVVVHGKPAILSAIDKRCEISVKERKDKKITVSSKDFSHNLVHKIEEVFEISGAAEKNLREFLKTSDVAKLSSFAQNELDFAAIAIGIVMRRLGKNPDRGFSLEINSDIPVGSGNGSSAAIAVGVTGALCRFFNQEKNHDEIFDIAFQIEKIKHGTPSGGDVASVLNGGFTWFQNVDGKKTIKTLDVKLSLKIADRFYLLDSGKPQESTGEMIVGVREFKEQNPKQAIEIFEDQERLVHELLLAIRNDDSQLLASVIKSAEKNLERLGVVSESTQNLIREIEKLGGAAKISGAGGKKKGSGTVLVFLPGNFDKLKFLNTRMVKALLGAKGLI